MSRATPKMRDFAERLITFETRGNQSSPTPTLAAFQVCDKLGPHLATLMGNGGFRALLARALTLASMEISWPSAVQVKPDGSLEGLEELRARLEPEEILEGGVVLVAQLLSLLVAFIGEDLTLRLVREVWPKASLEDFEACSGNGEKYEIKK